MRKHVTITENRDTIGGLNFDDASAKENVSRWQNRDMILIVSRLDANLCLFKQILFLK